MLKYSDVKYTLTFNHFVNVAKLIRGCTSILFSLSIISLNTNASELTPIKKASKAQSSLTQDVKVEPLLNGKFTQGSLIRGKLPANSTVFLNGLALDVNRSGDFVFGFGRDASLEHQLSWQLPESDQTHVMPITLQKREYKVQKIEGVAQKYVSPPTSVLERISIDNRALSKARAKKTDDTYFSQDFILPAQGRISGVYGSQRVFNGEPRRPHFGLDIANKTGTAVVAPASGTVTLAVPDMYYSGGTLIVDHGMGVSSTFIHLSKIHVQEGQFISQGELIAEIGATGRVTGPHLDWRINWFKERLDPALLVELPE